MWQVKPTTLTPSYSGNVYEASSIGFVFEGLMNVWVSVVLEIDDSMVAWAARST